MKKTYNTLLAILLMAATTACDDQLDIIPKGQTTLNNVTDLEYLLNQDYKFTTPACSDLGFICNESLGWSINIPETFSLNNTLDYAYLAFDENVDRATLTQSDARYEAAYKYINYMNVILDKLPDATGDDSMKPQIEAEAKIMRAYLHWLLVNIHAKQYDASTAADDGGIPYCDNVDVTEQKAKLTVAEVYSRILDDCSDDVIAALPANNYGDVLRADQAFGNAVRAKVLMQMKRYSDALPYALKALELNGAIEDRSTVTSTFSWTLEQTVSNNYVYMHGAGTVAPFMETLSYETGGAGASSTTPGIDDDDEDYDDYGDDDESYDEDYDDDDDDDDEGGETGGVDNGMFEAGDYLINYTSTWSSLFGQIMVGVPAKYCFAMTASVNEYGITSDRMYYTAAECYIRTGKIREGLALVDKVRACRVEDYEPFTDIYDASPLSEQEAMALMQKAKWIECIGTYENFFDCKRWNTEADYRRTITRDLGDDYGTFTLAPDSKLWILPFPANATRYNSSLTQNY